VLLLKAAALDDVGLFDDRFFLYGEETDWQFRAKALGWTVLYRPDIVARHIGGATSADPRQREALFHAAHETYMRKWHGSVGWMSYRLATTLGATARAALLSGARRGEAWRRAQIYARGPVRHRAEMLA